MTKKQKVQTLISGMTVGELGLLLHSMDGLKSSGEPEAVRLAMRALQKDEYPLAAKMVKARLKAV